MAGAASSREVIRHLNTIFQCGAVGQLSDAELLEQFVATVDATTRRGRLCRPR